MSESLPADEIVKAALKRRSTAEQTEYINSMCSGQPLLRSQVEKLLLEHTQAMSGQEPGAPVDATAVFFDPGTTLSFSPGSSTETAGTQIGGRYILRQQIGEGGMGTVWMADQTEPVKRKVALKLIRVERGQSKEILARFDTERQAIAVMDHPHIAKLLDAGTTETGSPFFVMELVKGVPLSDYCDEHRLTIVERLNLFQQICSAVQHAHQKGIIHRDLKPSNILVETHDGKPVSKVIDFGLAKAKTDLQAGGDSNVTAFGSVMGTPLYMAPEQATFNAVDVDTRADVYALGVILYELLTGVTPLSKEMMRKVAFDQMLKLIREKEPVSPSSCLNAVDSAPEVSLSRQMDQFKLVSFVKGELDWIVLKALSKDRERRYETANGFAQDLERFLNHEPVTAGPPSSSYRFKKFVQRNRGQVLAGSLVLIALVMGVIGTTWGLLEARRQAEFARVQEAEAKKQAEFARVQEAEAKKQAEFARAQETEARKKEAEANAVVQFFQDRVFAAARPEGLDGGLGSEVTLRKAIVASLPALDEGFADQPLVEAKLRSSLGATFEYLGEYESALKQKERALALYEQNLGPDHIDTLGSKGNLSGINYLMGRFDESLKITEEVLAKCRQVLPDGHPLTLDTMSNLALGYDQRGRHADGLKLKEEVLARRKGMLPEDHPEVLRGKERVAKGYLDTGRHDEALKLYMEVLEAQKRVLPEGHPETFVVMNNLAMAYGKLNRHEESQKLHEELLEARKRVLPKEHPDTLRSMNNLAMTYRALNRDSEAQKLLEEVVEAQKRVLSKDHPGTLQSMNNLAMTYTDLNRDGEAQKLFEEVLEARKRVLPKDHPSTLISMNNLAIAYGKLNRHEESKKLFEEVLEARKRVLPKDDPSTLTSMNNLAISYGKLNRHEESKKLYEEVLEAQKRVLPKDHPRTLQSMNKLAWLLATASDVRLQDPQRAVDLAAQAVEKSPTEWSFLQTLGVARYRNRDWIGAIADLEKSMSQGQAEDSDKALFGFFLAMAQWQLGAKDKAREWYDKSVQWMAKSKKDDAELKRFRAEAAALLGQKK